MEQLNNILQNIKLEEITAVIIAVIAVTKGFTSKFYIEDGNRKELITLIFSLVGFIWLLFKGNIIIDVVALFVVIYFGASGIYNFIPTAGIKEIEVTDIPEEYESLDVTKGVE